MTLIEQVENLIECARTVAKTEGRKYRIRGVRGPRGWYYEALPKARWR